MSIKSDLGKIFKYSVKTAIRNAVIDKYPKVDEFDNDSDDSYNDIYNEFYYYVDPKSFEGHPERKPEGCAACGGPYPYCRESCEIFDD